MPRLKLTCLRPTAISGRRFVRLLLGAVVASTTFGSCVAGAAGVITFETAASGVFANNFVLPVTEAGFTYLHAAGSLGTSITGNPGRDMEGALFTINEEDNILGGELTIVSSTPGALFTFQGLDASVVSTRSRLTLQPLTLSISLFGFRQGSTVTTDTYSLTGDGTFNQSWHAEAAVGLAGQAIDELRIKLPALSVPFMLQAFASIDNVALGDPVHAVPEPGPATQLGIGLAGIGLACWRRLTSRGASSQMSA